MAKGSSSELRASSISAVCVSGELEGGGGWRAVGLSCGVRSSGDLGKGTGGRVSREERGLDDDWRGKGGGGLIESGRGMGRDTWSDGAE